MLVNKTTKKKLILKNGQRYRIINKNSKYYGKVGILKFATDKMVYLLKFNKDRDDYGSKKPCPCPEYYHVNQKSIENVSKPK